MSYLLFMHPLPENAADFLGGKVEIRNGRKYVILEGDSMAVFEKARNTYPDTAFVTSGERCGMHHHPQWVGQFIGSHRLGTDWFARLERVAEAIEKF